MLTFGQPGFPARAGMVPRRHGPTSSIDFPDAVYHVTSRGNGRQVIFWNDEDRERFLAQLADNLHTAAVVLYAYVLMDQSFPSPGPHAAGEPLTVHAAALDGVRALRAVQAPPPATNFRGVSRRSWWKTTCTFAQ